MSESNIPDLDLVKTTITKDDGRLLIYYTWPEPSQTSDNNNDNH
jgi:hypothetical protein